METESSSSDNTEKLVCQLGLDINQKCSDFCKISKVKKEISEEINCLAALKIENFMLKGGFNFQIALKAFQVAPKEILEGFLNKDKSHYELFSYLLKIDLPESAATRALSLSNQSLYHILNSSFDSYLIYRDEQSIESYQKDFFSVGQNQFWRLISTEKIFSLISYCIRTENDMKISGLLLMLLDVDDLIKLKDAINLNEDETLRLYCSIIDEMNLLLKTYPHLYNHLLDVFKNYPDYLEIFKDYETDVIKTQRINDFIERFIEKYKNERSQSGLLQRLHTELSGLNLEEIKIILNRIIEKGVINRNQADMLIEFFTHGTFQFMEKISKNQKKNEHPIITMHSSDIDLSNPITKK